MDVSIVFIVSIILLISAIIYKIYVFYKQKSSRKFRYSYSDKYYHHVLFINYDFSTGNEKTRYEISKMYQIEPEPLFMETHDTSYFNFDSLSKFDDVIVLDRYGKYISLWELENHSKLYIKKEIRSAHSLERMLKAGAFEFIDINIKEYENRKGV